MNAVIVKKHPVLNWDMDFGKPYPNYIATNLRSGSILLRYKEILMKDEFKLTIKKKSNLIAFINETLQNEISNESYIIYISIMCYYLKFNDNDRKFIANIDAIKIGGGKWFEIDTNFFINFFQKYPRTNYNWIKYIFRTIDDNDLQLFTTTKCKMISMKCIKGDNVYNDNQKKIQKKLRAFKDQVLLKKHVEDITEFGKSLNPVNNHKKKSKMDTLLNKKFKGVLGVSLGRHLPLKVNSSIIFFFFSHVCIFLSRDFCFYLEFLFFFFEIQ